MDKKYKKSIYIFRRDLRLEDNTGLIKALELSELVIPIFILNPKQVTSENEFYNPHSIEFLFNTLRELHLSLEKKGSKLHLFYGKQLEILEELVKEHSIDAIFQNKDYTPFARKRDLSIKEVCSNLSIDCNLYHDYLLNAPKEVLKGDGTPYGVFTPYWKRASLNEVKHPTENVYENYFSIESSPITLLDKILPKKNSSLLLKGGRSEALSMIDNEIKNLDSYENERDLPSKQGTSRLSGHLKFGTISPRELYFLLQEHLKNPNPIQRQLYWRDFWVYITYHSPKVFKTTYIKKYEELDWQFNENKWIAWCEGKTGFPIVDAGMRELNTTGYMHNRVRMIVASFLTKDLHISYKHGEKYFGQKLLDYDPALNNGNWQWAASTGCDGQPYFRIFNPWRQQIRFDPNCEYIKKWIPEVRELTPKQLHNYFKKDIYVKDYPYPLVQHEDETPYAKNMFKSMI
jgi:deoxyribodipyrimidine photo-lyase